MAHRASTAWCTCVDIRVTSTRGTLSLVPTAPNGTTAARTSPWDAAHTLPYFRRMESVCASGAAADEAEVLPGRRGRDGPLHVSHGQNALGTPLYDAFIRAGGQAGYGSMVDYNGSRQEGCAKMPATVFHDGPRSGERCSTAAAYLEPALASRKLRTGALRPEPSIRLQPDVTARGLCGKVTWMKPPMATRDARQKAAAEEEEEVVVVEATGRVRPSRMRKRPRRDLALSGEM